MKKLHALFFLWMLPFLNLHSQPVNNECTGAVDVTQLFSDAASSSCATQVSGTYDNSIATSEPGDVTLTGFTNFETDAAGCTCELENGIFTSSELEGTLWFAFTPTATGNYFIEAIAQSSSQWLRRYA